MEYIQLARAAALIDWIFFGHHKFQLTFSFMFPIILYK